VVMPHKHCACYLLQKRQVECEPEKCPGNQGCYMLLHKRKDGCCSVCKGKHTPRPFSRN
jgi:hypothetical protein